MALLQGTCRRRGRWCIGEAGVLAVKGVAKLEADPVNLGYWVRPGSPPTSARGTPQRHPRLMHVLRATVKLAGALVAIRTTPEAAILSFFPLREANACADIYTRPARVSPCAISSVQVLLPASPQRDPAFLPHTSVRDIFSRQWRAHTSPWPWALLLSPH